MAGVESGRWRPPDAKLESLALYLRVELYELLRRAGSPSASDDPRQRIADLVKILRCECGRRPFRKAQAVSIVEGVAILRELSVELEEESKFGTPRGERLCRQLISQVKRLEDALVRK